MAYELAGKRDNNGRITDGSSLQAEFFRKQSPSSLLQHYSTMQENIFSVQPTISIPNSVKSMRQKFLRAKNPYLDGPCAIINSEFMEYLNKKMT
jgi:hypothetical protein